eukprot:g3275.t1
MTDSLEAYLRSTYFFQQSLLELCVVVGIGYFYCCGKRRRGNEEELPEGVSLHADVSDARGLVEPLVAGGTMEGSDIEGGGVGEEAQPMEKESWMEVLKSAITFLFILAQITGIFAQGKDSYPDILPCKNITIPSEGPLKPLSSCADQSIPGLERILLVPLILVNKAIGYHAFFFISGYLVPRSFDAKGGARFVSNRILSQGIPSIVFFHIFGPVWKQGVQVASLKMPLHISYLLVPVYGPMWLASWLLVFSCGYAAMKAMRPGSWTAELPGMVQMLAAAAVIGIHESVASIYGADQSLLPFAFFFSSGVAFQRNGWLSQLKDLPGGAISKIRWLTALVFTLCLYASGILIPKNYNALQASFWRGTLSVLLLIVIVHYVASIDHQRCASRVAQRAAPLARYAFFMAPIATSMAQWSLFALYFAGDNVSTINPESADVFDRFRATVSIQASSGGFLGDGWFEMLWSWLFMVAVTYGLVWLLASAASMAWATARSRKIMLALCILQQITVFIVIHVRARSDPSSAPTPSSS